MIYLRSFSFYIIYLLSGLLVGFAGCLIGPFLNISNRIKFLSAWPRFANWVLYKSCKIEVVVEGTENIPQYFFFPMTTLLKRELLFIPFWGWALALLRPIAINRGNPAVALKTALREGEKRIKKGFSILNFPEGTRKDPGEIGRYARSGFELAKKMQVPVLPIVHNSGDCWPAHRFLKFPGKINLTIGTPVENIESSAETAKKMEDWARKNLELIKRNN